jgi:hypothetical protein
MSNQSTENVSIGEGFAFFRFHTLVYTHSDCMGINDKSPGMGYCIRDWRRMNRG